MDARFNTVAVIGFGMIGASFAGAYREAYPHARILGVDVDAKALESGIERGWLDETRLADASDLAEFVCQADQVLIATPVPVAATWFQLLADADYRGIITDTCSTKKIVSAQAAEILPHPENYVPGHPMAGSEKSGVDGSRVDLFEGAHWVLCPDDSTEASTFAALHEMLTGLGARVVSLSREDHDDAIAIVSHVPHFVASSLVELAVRHARGHDELFRLAAGGFKDSTRIAAGSPSLWTGIAFDNLDAIVSGLEEMRAILGEFSQALSAHDKAAFAALLDQAAQARRSLPVRWVPATEDLLEVRIPLTDRPGIIAEVTTIASQAGCNIQSIEIDHITSSSAELLLVLTDEGDVGKLSTQLLKAGFRISFNPLISKGAQND